MAAGGVLIVVVCAALGASVAGRSGSGTPYLEVVQAVPAGATIDQADLSVVDLGSGSGLAGVPAGDEASVVGTRASVPLAVGSLLVPADVSAAPPVPKGDAVVGASLSPDQLPTEVEPGDSVLVVLTDSTGPAASGGGSTAGATGSGRPATAPTGVGEVLAAGVVVDVAPPGSTAAVNSSSTGTTVVSLAVPAAVAAEVTAASAADQVSLALVAPPPAARGGNRP